jgi:DNA-directed RNA polymerase subunit RPC12/RpoP
LLQPRLADVVRRHGSAYLKRHGGAVLPSHAAALSAIAHCRTPCLGAHLGQCARCERRHLLYHSCRHRACPRCGYEQTETWLARQRQLLLAVPYFHVTFTLPSELRRLVRSHQRELIDVLCRAAYQALSQMCADERHLGGRIGVLAVVHTWTRALIYHPHVHMLLPAGALADDGSWRPARKRGRKLYLVPERALAKLFAGKFLSMARKALAGAGVTIPTIAQGSKWIVAIRRVQPGPEVVLSYLGRYVHRTAVSDSAIVALDDDTVTFRYTDSRSRSRKTMRLAAHEFLRRLLQHVLPKGLHRVRSYGLLHPAHRVSLRRLQLLLGVPPVDVGHDEHQQLPRLRCPHCRIGALVLVRRLSPDECLARIERRAATPRAPPPPLQPRAQS